MCEGSNYMYGHSHWKETSSLIRGCNRRSADRQGSCCREGEAQWQRKLVKIRQPNTKSNPNPNPTTKQQLSIKLNIVACPGLPEKFIRYNVTELFPAAILPQPCQTLAVYVVCRPTVSIALTCSQQSTRHCAIRLSVELAEFGVFACTLPRALCNVESNRFRWIPFAVLRHWWVAQFASLLWASAVFSRSLRGQFSAVPPLLRRYELLHFES